MEIYEHDRCRTRLAGKRKHEYLAHPPPNFSIPRCETWQTSVVYSHGTHTGSSWHQIPEGKPFSSRSSTTGERHEVDYYTAKSGSTAPRTGLPGVCYIKKGQLRRRSPEPEVWSRENRENHPVLRMVVSWDGGHGPQKQEGNSDVQITFRCRPQTLLGHDLRFARMYVVLP